MGVFAKTAIVDYHLSFAYQGKKTSFFCFLLQKTNRNLPFPFSVCTNKGKLPFSTSSIFGVTETWRHGHGDSGDMETWRHGDIEIETWKHREMGTWTWRQGEIKQKTETEAQVIFLNPFTVSSSCQRKFVVCPFVAKEINRSYFFANRLNGLNRLAYLCTYVHNTYYP